MPEVFPSNFLLNSGECQVIVISFTVAYSKICFYKFFNIFTVVCSKICFFIFFNNWKMRKMLKIGCFKQNHCTSGMPQGIPMQFFAQQW